MALVLFGCAGEVESTDDSIPSPDELAKADGETFRVRGSIEYGQTVTGRLYGTRTYAGYTFDALAGASLAPTATPGESIALYGPVDRGGKYGPHPVHGALPEDGRYVVIVGGKMGNFSLTLACTTGCDVDPDAGKVLINSASASELTAAGLDGSSIVTYRQRYGMASTLGELGVVADNASAMLDRVFFSPKFSDGFGWATTSRAQQAFVKQKTSDTVDWTEGDVASPVVDLFRRAEHEIDLAMYGFALSTDEGQALLDAAARGVAVKVYLDVSERDPNGNPYTAGVIQTLVNTPNVEVRVPKYSSKTMHEKFGIVDGLHVFDGSSNVSQKARDVYTEDRFVLTGSPAAAAQFGDEWNRLWNRLGKDAHLILQ